MTTPPAPPRLAIVTGADSGTGKATADLLATEGYDIGITFHTDEAGARDTRRAVEQRGQRCVVAQHDAAGPHTAHTIEELIDQLGGVGVLVNNAGTGHSTPVLDLDLATWAHVVATDLTGPFLNAQVAARHMVEQERGGRIINITSVHEHLPRYGAAAYCTAKAGLGMLTDGGLSLMAAHGNDTATGWRHG